jgi:hypothetical protein
VREHQSELADFAPVSWNLVVQLENFYSLAAEPEFKKSEGLELTPQEEAIFDRWQRGEFADVFFKHLSRSSVHEASASALAHLDRHLTVFGERHIRRTDSHHAFYRTQTSLGEIKKKGKPVRLLETTLHLNGKELRLMTASMRDMKRQSQRIEAALKVIRHHSPDSWERFAAFTEVIIPIRQKEFVSYSHQELPGHSMLNLADRDFVDLMDDLIHENGHHHLNYYLNLGALIEEPEAQSYYSPWRRSPRPLRGIYHAYFTFFWAFKLFSDMARSRELDSIWYVFTDEQREKIYWRAVEEYYLLSYSFEDLRRARKKGLIHKAGWELVEKQHKELRKNRLRVQSWEKQLKAHRKALRELKRELKVGARVWQSS